MTNPCPHGVYTPGRKTEENQQVNRQEQQGDETGATGVGKVSPEVPDEVKPQEETGRRSLQQQGRDAQVHQAAPVPREWGAVSVSAPRVGVSETCTPSVLRPLGVMTVLATADVGLWLI